MPSLYDPSSVEWLALIAVLGVNVVASANMSALAVGAQWRVIWKKLNSRIIPCHNGPARTLDIVATYFNPYLYAALRFLMNALGAFAFWWVWRQGFRSEFSGLYAKPPSVVIDSDYYFLSGLFYLIFQVAVVVAPLIHFNLGLTHGWLSTSLFFEFLTFASSLLCTIFFWLNIPLAGILSLIVTVYYGYSLYVFYYFTGMADHKGLIGDVVDSMFDIMYPPHQILAHRLGVIVEETHVHQQTYPQQQTQYGQFQEQPKYAVYDNNTRSYP